MPDKSYSVSVKGLSRLEHIPGGIDKAQREFLGEAADRIAEEVADAAPHKSGRLARSWHGRTLTSTKAEVFSDSPYAKSQDRGAYITAKNHKVLRFTAGGEERFARFVRIPATNYTRKGLRKRGTIIRQVFDEKFDQLDV